MIEKSVQYTSFSRGSVTKYGDFKLDLIGFVHGFSCESIFIFIIPNLYTKDIGSEIDYTE